MNPQRVEDFVVAVNEIMTNAVRHGGGGGRFRLWWDGNVLYEITDRGPGFEHSPYVDRVEPPSRPR